MDLLLPQTPTTRPKHVWRKSSRQILIVRPPMATLMTFGLVTPILFTEGAL